MDVTNLIVLIVSIARVDGNGHPLELRDERRLAFLLLFNTATRVLLCV